MHKRGFVQAFLLGIMAVVIILGTIRYFYKIEPSTVAVSNSTEVVVAVKNDISPVVYPKVSSGDYTFNFTSKDGLSRTYRVYIPRNYDSLKKYPVLFGFHGGFGTAEQFEKSTNFSALADESGYIAVYGQGLSFAKTYAPVWNAGGCCGQAVDSQKNIDDVGYVRSVVSQVEKKYNIDSSRIFAAGMSNGGMFSNRLACEAADIFSGVAVVSGTIQINTCNPSRKMPILLIHGTQDENVPYYGGQGSKAINQSTYISVEQELADWGNRNGCSGAVVTASIPPLVNDGNTVNKLTFPNCRAETTLYRINGGIHEWPGGGANQNPLEKPSPTKVLDASKTIIDFFGL